MIFKQENSMNREHIEDLSFAHWQYTANEKAYENKLITTAMYEFAKEKLQKKIDDLSNICYCSLR